MHGYRLRTTFEASTGGTWPLNVGQVYTTLARLARDGMVAREGEEGQSRSLYRITEDGRAEVRRWFATPVSRESRPRDELAIKLAVALGVPGLDIHEVIQAQRSATVRSLQELTRLKAHSAEDDLAWLLVLDAMLFQAEAEVRWLDDCEARIARHGPVPARGEGEPPAREDLPAEQPAGSEHPAGSEQPAHLEPPPEAGQPAEVER